MQRNFPAAYLSAMTTAAFLKAFFSPTTYGYPAYDLSKSCSADKQDQQPLLTATQAMITSYLTFSLLASVRGGSLGLCQEQGRLKKCLDVLHE